MEKVKKLESLKTELFRIHDEDDESINPEYRDFLLSHFEEQFEFLNISSDFNKNGSYYYGLFGKRNLQLRRSAFSSIKSLSLQIWGLSIHTLVITLVILMQFGGHFPPRRERISEALVWNWNFPSPLANFANFSF